MEFWWHNFFYCLFPRFWYRWQSAEWVLENFRLRRHWYLKYKIFSCIHVFHEWTWNSVLANHNFVLVNMFSAHGIFKFSSTIVKVLTYEKQFESSFLGHFSSSNFQNFFNHGEGSYIRKAVWILHFWGISALRIFKFSSTMMKVLT